MIEFIWMIITLATPHLLPPFSIDLNMINVYNEINDIRNYTSNIIISISGGYADMQIPDILSNINSCHI